DVGPTEVARGELQTAGNAQPSSSSETTTVPVQAGPKMALTSVDAGGRSGQAYDRAKGWYTTIVDLGDGSAEVGHEEQYLDSHQNQEVMECSVKEADMAVKGFPSTMVKMKGIQQLQELQAQALAKGAGATANAEVLKPGTMALAPLPDLKGGCEAALSFQDWLEVSSSVLGDVSEQSSNWWKAVINVVSDTYDRWLRATPLERLAIAPDGADELSTGKWARLNARVASMLLAAMTTDLRGEMVTQRISQNVVRMVYRLHTLYQPGGSAERSDVLVRLQAPRDYLSVDSLEEVLKLVRSWPTYRQVYQSVSRCCVPDIYAENLAAPGPRVKAVDALQPKAKDGAARTPAGGDRCTYSHSMAGLDKAAQQVVQQGAEPQSDGSPEKTRPVIKTLRLMDIRVCSMESAATALLDSGATHSLRSAANAQEWLEAEEVAVQLAGNHHLTMRITQSGTLLMPRQEDREGHGKLAIQDRKLERLENEMLTTRDKVGLSAVAMERHWNHYLYDYVGKGSFESGLRAVRDAPFFEDLPGECISGLIPGAGLENGWEIFKLNGFLTRPQRRKLMGSKRWVVHLFAGKEGHWELMQLDQGETSVVELDLARCSGHSILRDEIWRMLLWGAKHGKVDVVLGGPPGRLHQHCNGGERDVNSLKLIARMMWLYVVAQAGRELNASGINVNRDVAFVMEYPEGFPASQRQAREQEIQRAEDASRVPGRGQGASWEQTRRYWEQVQRPRWEDQVGRSTLNGDVAFWDTRMWKGFQRELEMRTVSFDQGAMGGFARNSTTLGTNVNSLMALSEVRLPEDDPAPPHGDRDYIWAPGLVRAIKVALSVWERHPQCAPRMCAMTAEQWKNHVRTNHAVYRKDCATCVMSRGLGRQHRRIHHPEAYVLTADVAGPLSPGLDATSKGALGKGLRYLLIGKYLVPKQFIEECFGNPTSLDIGTEQAPEALPLTEEQQRDMEELFGESEVRDASLPEVPQVEVIGIAGDERDDVENSEEVAECDDQEPVQEEEPAEEEVERPSDVVMEHGDCVAPEMTFLTFAAALPNNQSATVKRGVQDMVLYLQNHGFPIYRFHADKGEFYNHGFRNWLRDQGVYGTWSEPSVPQGNGQAESTVRWIKDRTRTLLRASGLPMRLWPTAAATAAAEQRAKVLGWKSQLAAPYGAPVHLRKKGFDKAGPLRRELGLESKWLVGKYVGLSSIVHNGHLVYVPQDGDEKEKFLHTMHVRANLVEPGTPDEDLYIATPPKPRRRITEKTDSKEVQMRAITMTSDEVKELATVKAKEITDDWSLVRAMALVEKLAEGGFFEQRKFGVYRHGGTVGWLSSVEEFPDLTRLLTKIVLEINPEAAFTSVLVSHNTPRTMHKDFNNDYATKNVVVPICCPDQGGELWIELKAGDVVRGTIEQRSNGKQMVFGQMLPLVQGGGEAIRAVMGEVPQYGQDWSNDSPWSMYLQLEEGMVKIADAVEEESIGPRLNKVEVSYTPKIEEVLSQLTGPLDVTHAVSPDEVMANLEAWRPSILKELAGIEGAVEKLPPGSDARRRWLGKPNIQRLPMKFVFTVKPNDKAVLADRSTWFKRKSRLVICGNFAVSDGTQVYAETAPAEAVRTGLTISSRNRWCIAILDVVAAFLKTPLGRSPRDPVVVAQPPRLLESLGISVKMELWGLLRALYGLREAPLLWGNFRDDTLRELETPRGLKWKQGKAITSWWSILDSEGRLTALVVVYVDDFMICGPRKIVTELGDMVQKVWETSELTFLGPGSPIRFLGMELQREAEDSTEILVLQQGYIQELLRTHGVKSVHLDKIPITKELSVLPETQEAPDPEVIRNAQQITGEVLWVAQRTRPDLSFATCIMASLCTRNPTQTLSIGRKILGYLQRTSGYGLVINWQGQGLMMYSDASYAPQGCRSHGGWVVMYGGVPISWRSGRQSMITLSTAEAELLALLEGAVAAKSTEAILSDIGERIEERTIATDSTSALSIASGSSSW
ncbi:TY5A, partial [Symbiodinium sp. CCMP2456]